MLNYIYRPDIIDRLIFFYKTYSGIVTVYAEDLLFITLSKIDIIKITRNWLAISNSTQLHAIRKLFFK